METVQSAYRRIATISAGSAQHRRSGRGKPPRVRGETPRAARLPQHFSVGIDNLELAELEAADRLLDLLEVADDDPGQRAGLDDGDRLLELIEGERGDPGGALLGIVVGPAVERVVAERAEHGVAGLVAAGER